MASNTFLKYRGCQKNVPIEDLFSATTPYAAILFSEHYYDKRYNFGLAPGHDRAGHPVTRINFHQFRNSL